MSVKYMTVLLYNYFLSLLVTFFFPQYLLHSSRALSLDLNIGSIEALGF